MDSIVEVKYSMYCGRSVDARRLPVAAGPRPILKSLSPRHTSWYRADMLPYTNGPQADEQGSISGFLGLMKPAKHRA